MSSLCRRLPRWYAWALLSGIIISDQLTKHWFLQHFHYPGQSREVIPGFFHLTYVTNDGVAFGMFQGGNRIMLVIVLLLLAFSVYYVRKLDWRRPEFGVLAGLIGGGATGNIIDRLRHGHVVDFLDFNLGIMRWPAFNIADAAITCATAWILMRILTGAYDPPREESDPPSPSSQ